MSTSLRDSLHELFRNWRDELSPNSISSLYQFQRANISDPAALQRLVRQTVGELLTSLEASNKMQADILRLRFLDGYSVFETSNQLNTSEGNYYKVQANAIDWLAARMEEREQMARQQDASRFLLRLEAPTHTDLVGVGPHLVKLIALLSTPEPPWLIAIEGMGGIGKTALTNVLMRHMIGLPGYLDFAWVTARHTHLDLEGELRNSSQPLLTTESLVDHLVRQLSNEDGNLISYSYPQKLAWLQRRLKHLPHLIVIDNLESLLDLETLLPILQQLCNPSRFLLTSRVGLRGEPNIHYFQVPLLSEEHAIRVMRNEAKIRDFPVLSAASDTQLHTIYKTVGGNPLALRLVVGLLDSDTIENILADLHEARGAAVDNLYTYLYHTAYRRLDKVERRVWLALSLVIAPMATVEMLTASTLQEPHVVRDALRKLVHMNLVDCHGDLSHRTYSIHPLTHTFLERQIGKWEARDDNAHNHQHSQLQS